MYFFRYPDLQYEKGSERRDIFLRTIPGLKAVEEAVGRSTEMGKPVLFVPGISDMDQVETVAGVIVLGHVSKMTARYETPLNVPVSRAIVMKAAREACKNHILLRVVQICSMRIWFIMSRMNSSLMQPE